MPANPSFWPPALPQRASCLREGPDGWWSPEKGRGSSPNSSVSPGLPPQATESEEQWSSHFHLGPQDSTGTALPGPKSTVPGSSAWSLSLEQEELRTVPHPKALPLPWRLLTTLVQEAHSSAERAKTRPRGDQGLEWSPVPYLSCQSHEAESPREPGMSGSGRRTEDCQLFNPEPGMSQLAPSSSPVPPHRLCSTQAPLFPGPATCTGNEAS